jgi:hypothetical protein
MKNFRLYFSPLILIVLVLAVLISLFSLGLNVYYVIYTPPFDVAIKYVLLSIVCLFLAVFAISLIFSRYLIKGDKLVLILGLIKIKYSIKEIVQTATFENGKSLVIYFKDAKFSRVMISKTRFQDFSKALKEVNSRIILYSSENESK